MIVYEPYLLRIPIIFYFQYFPNGSIKREERFNSVFAEKDEFVLTETR
jgi:hypothetical protein